MDILITGGTGFLGRRVIQKLILDPHLNLHLIYRRNSNLDFLSFDQRKRINLLNVEDYENIDNLIKNKYIHTVLHMATHYDRNGRQISDVVEANLILPLKILVSGDNLGIKHFINVDSFYTKAEYEYKRLFNYTQSKRALIPWLKNFSENMLVSNLTLEHMYGPGDRNDKLIPSLIDHAKENWSTDIIQSGGEQIRDFIYVDDVVSALECVVKSTKNPPVGFRLFEVGTAVGTTLRELTSEISGLLGCTKQPNFRPGVYPPYEIMSSVARNESLTALGWRPKYSLHEGLSETIKDI